jgi:CheY-like chemotaxis protein
MAARDPDPVAPRVEAMATAPQQSRRVLVIDDIADLRFLIRAHLERRGFDVVADAADPDVGQALAEQHHPDGVIIDMTMPGFDVLAAIGRLRETLPDASILAASATPADIDNEGLACAAGADGYFDKAAGFDDLVRQFASLFGRTVRTVEAG